MRKRFARKCTDILILFSKPYYSLFDAVRVFCGLYVHPVFPSASNFHTIYREVFILGDYFVPVKGKNPVIFDVGGNIGLASLFFKKLWPEARVTIFEPLEENALYIKRNTQGMSDVTIHTIALAAEAGEQTFFQAPTPGGGTLVEDVAQSKGRTKFTEIHVRTERLSTFITEDIDLLKMDVEGSEGVIIKELADSGTLSRVKCLVFEYHVNRQNKANNFAHIVTTLELAGFIVDCYNNDLFGNIEAYPTHFMVRARQL